MTQPEEKSLTGNTQITLTCSFTMLLYNVIQILFF